MKNISELRQDIITGDWVVVATGRARRPNDFAARTARVKSQPKKSCPFEKLLPEALLAYDRAGGSFRVTGQDRGYLEKNWWVQVAPNKYPAFGRGVCSLERKIGPYRWQDGVGFHEVIITRDHTRAMASMSTAEISLIIRAYRHRYLAIKDEDCIEYISVFHNHGPESGATISHPHSQLIAIPVIPPDISRSLAGSAEYFHKHKKCPHCVLLDFELKDKKRLIFVNSDFAAFCPFISRQAFEIRIFPRRHRPHFEKITESEIENLAEALRATLAKQAIGLKSPAYNFFIHTAPVSGVSELEHYHWHIEILPKTAIWAGFEIGTGIEISTIAPERAAPFLRQVRV